MNFGDIDRDLAFIGKQLEKNPDDWEAWAAKADILCSLGMYEVAIRCCDKSLAINPGNAHSLMTRGNALEKLGKHEEANVDFAKAREMGYRE